MPGEKGNSSNVKTIYVTDLAEGVQENELVAVCRTYGKVQNIWVAPASPRFAIVEFEKAEDAADIVYDLHGEVFCGRKLSVQLYKRQMAPQRPRSPPSKSPEAKRLKRSKRDRRTPMQYRKKRKPISPSDSGKSSSSDEAVVSPVKAIRSIEPKKRSPSFTERSSSRCRSPSRSTLYEKASVRKRPRSRSRPFADASPESSRYERRRKSPKVEYASSRRTPPPREYSKRRSPVDYPRRRPPSPARRYDKRPPSPPPQRPDRRSPDLYESRRMTKRSESPPRRNYFREREEVHSPAPRYSGASMGRGGPRYTSYQDPPFSRRGRPPSPSPTTSGRGQYYSRNKSYQEPYQRSGQSYRGSYTPRGPYRDRREVGNDNESKQTDFNKDKGKANDVDWDVQEAAKLLATTICNEEDWDLEDDKEPSNSKPKHGNITEDDWGSPPKSKVQPSTSKSLVFDDGENWDTVDVNTKEPCKIKDNYKHNDNPFSTEKSSVEKVKTNSSAQDWSCASEKRQQKSAARGTTPVDGDWDSPESTPVQVVAAPERKRSVEATSGSWSSKSNTAASRGEELEDVSDEDELDIHESSKQKSTREHRKTPRSPSKEEWTNIGGSKSESRKIRGLTPDDGGWDDEEPKVKESINSTRDTTVIKPKSDKQKQFRCWETISDTKPQIAERNESHSDNHRDESKSKKSRATKPAYDDRQDDWKSEQRSSRDAGHNNKRRGVTPDEGDWD